MGSCVTLTMSNLQALEWGCDDVAKWIIEQGFPQYESCFRNNFICGKKLFTVDGSSLPKLGVNDYEDIKAITRLIKTLLNIPYREWDRSITYDVSELEKFLDIKSRSGKYSNELTLEGYQQELKEKEEAVLAVEAWKAQNRGQ